MDPKSLQKRIGYSGNLENFFKTVVRDYELGTLHSFTPILQGYEDFNVKVETDKGKYLIKVLGKFRTDGEAIQYAQMMELAVNQGVSHPKIYTSPQGSLYRTNLDGVGLRLIVMDFIEGQDFYTLKEKPTEEEKIFLVREAAKISKINFKPQYIYDSWAVPNFPKEYNLIKNKLDKGDLAYLGPLVETFPKLQIDNLPHSFIHGDLIATNLVRAKDDKLYIIDFAVANYYPRIQELAVLLCDLLFVNDKEKYLANYNLALKVYQETVKLTKEELHALPTYIKLAHAMHIVPATREKTKGNNLPENEFWLKSGQEGVRIASELWT